MDRGSGGRAPSGVQGQRPGGGEARAGEARAFSPFFALVGVKLELVKLELFLNQNCPESHQLTRMVVTHVYNTCTGERKKEGGKKKK